jgi:hypothetical protein
MFDPAAIKTAAVDAVIQAGAGTLGARAPPGRRNP